MDKMLYYASLVERVHGLLFLIICIVILTGLISFWLLFDVEKEEYRKKAGKVFVLSLVLFVAFSTVSCFMPTKRQVYIISLTKDYNIEDMQKLSEEDIDELIRKVDKLDKATEVNEGV